MRFFIFAIVRLGCKSPFLKFWGCGGSFKSPRKKQRVGKLPTLFVYAILGNYFSSSSMRAFASAMTFCATFAGASS